MDGSSLNYRLGDLRAVARRYSRIPDEAEDLLQDALLEAIRAEKTDLSRLDNYRWLVGVIRNLGAMTARGAVRRRIREARWNPQEGERGMLTLVAESDNDITAALAELSPALRRVAQLALSGHDRREIAWLLKLSDTALRQRIAALKRWLSTRELELPKSGAVSESLGLYYGLIRRALLPVVIATHTAGVYDPDGHLLMIGSERPHISASGGN